MSFRDYLHEKAEESRHNETVAYLMFLAGTVFFVGGILENLLISSEVGRPEWFLFIPYHAVFHSGTLLGLALIICGLTLIVYGITAGISYSSDRSWYMNELRKANSMEEVLMSKKRVTGETKQKSTKKTTKKD